MSRRVALLLLASAGIVAAGVPLAEYRERRVALRKALPDSVIVLFGRVEDDEEDLRTGFRQEANFRYLTGWTEPGAVMILTPQTELLLLPRRNARSERYTGPKAAPDDASIRDLTGFADVAPSETVESQILKAVESAPKVYTLTHRSAAARLKALLPMRDILDAGPAIAKLRMKKSPAELSLLERSIAVTLGGQRAAWHRLGPGVAEYQSAAAVSHHFLEQGCEGHSFAPIVASGPNGVTLHYSRNHRRMDRGELVVLDLGAECAGYAADITRTPPVSGKYSKRQRELYELVLGAQNAAIQAVKPGATLRQLTDVAREYMNAHGKDLKGRPLGEHFTHGIGHHVGLDVHDAADNAAPLEAGMVITIEPGVYIPDEKTGIRIEDMVLVTESGGKLLSGALPREPQEVERALVR